MLPGKHMDRLICPYSHRAGLVLLCGTYHHDHRDLFSACRFVCRTTAAVFAKEKRELCVIGFLPLMYYIFDYATTKFSSLLYSGNAGAFHSAP